nr:MAG TPA: hypothetical protein [Caudoviricetes sp.]
MNAPKREAAVYKKERMNSPDFNGERKLWKILKIFCQ